MRPGPCLVVLVLVLALSGTAQSRPLGSPSVRTAGGALTVEGRPYFPVFSWAACPQDVDRDLAVGVNVFMHHGENCGGEQGLLDELGFRAYYLPGLDSPLSLAGDDPRLFGYVQPDEPDGHGIGPEQLRTAPGHALFMTLTTYFVHSLPRYRDPGAQALYRDYRSKADMFGVAVYPLSHLCGLTGLEAVYEVQRDLVSFAGTRPTFQWLETGGLEGGCGAPVTPAAVAAEVWLSIAGGARGLGWFTYAWPDGRAESFHVDPEIADEMARQTARIQHLAPVLLAPVVRVGSHHGDPVKLGGRTRGGRTYLIAANSVDVGIAWERGALPGLMNQRVSVVGEQRTLRADHGILRDRFDPLGVHIYAYVPR